MIEPHRADGVFQGGGVKGIGLVGALLEFGENPKVEITEWVNVAGTSAGSIIAALLACGKSPTELRSLLLETNFSEQRTLAGAASSSEAPSTSPGTKASRAVRSSTTG
jgi:predicted acylesterase/phospholipase RssA